MVTKRKYEIGDCIECVVIKPITYAPGVSRLSEQKATARVIGYEWWTDNDEWLYHIMSSCYDFTLKCTEDQMTPLRIRIIGINAKVLSNEKEAK